MKKIKMVLLFLFILTAVEAQKNKLNLVIGTYTNKCDSKGIYVYDFDTKTGEFELKSTTENVMNPSYLTVSVDNNFVYSVNENGIKSTVSAFEYNAASGSLKFINKENVEGTDPCYVINDDKNIIVANYSSGNINVFGKNNDGSIAELKQVEQHLGKGINAARQERPHAHMVYFSPDKKYVFSNDLGNDKVYTYSYMASSDKNVLQLKETFEVKPGSGPRHLIFSKNGKFVYLLNELDGSILAFDYKDGKLNKIDETTVLVPGFTGKFGAADIHVSPDGNYLYASNRIESNTISIFKILKNGKLESKGQTSSLGINPRNFVIDPTGKFLLVGNQSSNAVVIFKRDKKTGMLTDTGKRIEMCSPVCLVFTKQ